MLTAGCSMASGQRGYHTRRPTQRPTCMTHMNRSARKPRKTGRSRGRVRWHGTMSWPVAAPGASKAAFPGRPALAGWLGGGGLRRLWAWVLPVPGGKPGLRGALGRWRSSLD